MEAYIALGSNLGDRKAWIEQGVFLISQLPTTRILAQASLVEGAAVASEAQPDFFNGMIRIETELSVNVLFEGLRVIEISCGRVDKGGNQPRQLDLDIIAYGNHVISTPELQIPHPRLQNRSFVLGPFFELNPEWVHPIINRSIRSLWLALDWGIYG